MVSRPVDEIHASGPVLIVGLGNPGARYRATRHNVGFRVVDRLQEQLGVGRESRFHRSELTELWREGRQVLLLKPGLFMNRSGEPTIQAVHRFGVPNSNMLVVYDDLDLQLGRVRLRQAGGSGGHRGVQDIIAALGDPQFPRLRVGVGRPETGMPAEAHVLARFPEEQRPIIDRVLETATEAAACWLDEGIRAAMDRYNARPDEASP